MYRILRKAIFRIASPASTFYLHDLDNHEQIEKDGLRFKLNKPIQGNEYITTAQIHKRMAAKVKNQSSTVECGGKSEQHFMP